MSDATTVTFTEDELDERLNWAACGATNAALRGVEAGLRARAGELYAAGKDEIAGEVRRLARHYDGLRKSESERLQGFINRDAKSRGATT